MSDIVKNKLADASDLSKQIALEMKIKGREAAAPEKADGSKPLLTKDNLHNAEDKLEQVKLEVDKKARHAKQAVAHSTVGEKTSDVARTTKDALVDAKDALADAVAPETKVVEATSTRGVDITHVEGGSNASLARDEQKAKDRAARDAELEAEKKREALLHDMAVAKESASAVLSQVAGKAEVVLGQAALAAKDALDAYTDDRPVEKVTPRVSNSGVDISAVQNARNDELLAKEQHRIAIEKAHEPTLGEKIKTSLSHAGETIKDAFTQATTEAPKPVYVHKTTSSGIDISHAENPNNPILLEREIEKAKTAEIAATQREKAVVQAELLDPAKAKAAEEAHTLQEKMSALGESIQRAAHKAGDAITAKYNELAHPPEVHEKTSERGIDTTSIANPDNDKLGEEYKARHSLLPHSTSEKKESTKDVLIRSALDAGVAVKEGAEKLSTQAQAASADLKAQANVTAIQADRKLDQTHDAVVLKKQAIKTDTAIAAHDASAKIQNAQAAVVEQTNAAKAKVATMMSSSDASANKTGEGKADLAAKTSELKEKAIAAKDAFVAKSTELLHEASVKAAELKNDLAAKTANAKHDMAAKSTTMQTKTDRKMDQTHDAAILKKQAIKTDASIAAHDASVKVHHAQDAIVEKSHDLQAKAIDLKNDASVKATELKNDLAAKAHDVQDSLAAKSSTLQTKAGRSMDRTHDAAVLKKQAVKTDTSIAAHHANVNAHHAKDALVEKSHQLVNDASAKATELKHDISSKASELQHDLSAKSATLQTKADRSMDRTHDAAVLKKQAIKTDAAIATHDAGVATQHAKESMVDASHSLEAKASELTRDLSTKTHDAIVKTKVAINDAGASMRTKAHQAGDAISSKASDLKAAAASASMSGDADKEGAVYASESSSRPDFIRMKTLPVVATASPITPGADVLLPVTSNLPAVNSNANMS